MNVQDRIRSCLHQPVLPQAGQSSVGGAWVRCQPRRSTPALPAIAGTTRPHATGNSTAADWRRPPFRLDAGWRGGPWGGPVRATRTIKTAFRSTTRLQVLEGPNSRSLIFSNLAGRGAATHAGAAPDPYMSAAANTLPRFWSTSPPREPSMVATTWELIPWAMVALRAPWARFGTGGGIAGDTVAVVRTTDTCEVCHRCESVICCAECKECVCADCACEGCYDSWDSPRYCDYCRSCCPNRRQLQRATRCQYTKALDRTVACCGCQRRGYVWNAVWCSGAPGTPGGHPTCGEHGCYTPFGASGTGICSHCWLNGGDVDAQPIDQSPLAAPAAERCVWGSVAATVSRSRPRRRAWNGAMPPP